MNFPSFSIFIQSNCITFLDDAICNCDISFKVIKQKIAENENYAGLSHKLTGSLFN